MTEHVLSLKTAVRPAFAAHATKLLVLLSVLGLSYFAWLHRTELLRFLPGQTTPAGNIVKTTVQLESSSPLQNMKQEAELALQKLDLRAARKLWEQIIIQEPLNAENYNNLGFVLRKLGRWEAAHEQYQKALQLNPKFTAAYNNLGALALARSDYERASQYLKQALQLDPEYADAYLNLGWLYELQGRPEMADEAYASFLNRMQDANSPLRLELELRRQRLNPTKAP